MSISRIASVNVTATATIASTPFNPQYGNLNATARPDFFGGTQIILWAVTCDTNAAGASSNPTFSWTNIEGNAQTSTGASAVLTAAGAGSSGIVVLNNTTGAAASAVAWSFVITGTGTNATSRFRAQLIDTEFWVTP